MSVPAMTSESNTQTNPLSGLADPVEQQGQNIHHHHHMHRQDNHHHPHHHDVLINSGSVAFLPVGVNNNTTSQMATSLTDSVDKWAPPSFNAYNKPNKTIQKQSKKKPQRPIEIIVCKGTETVVPKSRSQGERRYVCNGHTIHRVTFWRHRKHGCPHGNGQNVQSKPKQSTQSKISDEGQTSMDIKPNMTTGSISQLPPVAEGECMEGHPHIMQDSMDFSGQMHSALPMEMNTGPVHRSIHGVKAMPVSMSFPMMDGSIDLSMQSQGKLMKGPNMVPGMPSMKSPFPGLDSMMSDAVMSGSAPPTHMGHMPAGTLPPFSLMPDQLNFVYAPYQPADPDEEEINALTSPYVGPGSPYASDRSDASDFLDDGDLFNSYLERSNGI